MKNLQCLSSTNDAIRGKIILLTKIATNTKDLWF